MYVGGTVDYKRRVRIHRHRLNHGIHHSKSLQQDFDIYGKQAFRFAIIEAIDDASKLHEIEQQHIERLMSNQPEHGYNVLNTPNFHKRKN